MRPKFLCSAILVLLAACLFTSCQKELSVDDSTGTPGNTNPPANGTSQELPKTITESMTVSGSKIYDETYNISYDAQSRITLMQSTSNAGNKFVYSYKASSYSITLYISNMLSNYGEYFLAANKTIDSSLQYNDSKDTTTEKYSYNAKGQIEKVLQYEYSTAKGSVLYDIFLYTYDAKGNITKEERSMSTTTYTYYDDLKTPFNFLVPYHTTNPNLPKTETNNGIAMTYKYTFDSKGRLVQTEGTSNVGEMVEITKYTY